MAGKIDRALGAFCIAFAAFFLVAAFMGEGEGHFSGLASTVTLWIALLAAIPGIWLLVKGRTV